jgi:hypothetical protein
MPPKQASLERYIAQVNPVKLPSDELSRTDELSYRGRCLLVAPDRSGGDNRQRTNPGPGTPFARTARARFTLSVVGTETLDIADFAGPYTSIDTTV